MLTFLYYLTFCMGLRCICLHLIPICGVFIKQYLYAVINNPEVKINKRKAFTYQERIRIASDQRYLCIDCMRLLPETWILDHRIALASNGTNNRANVCIICPNCHALKTERIDRPLWTSRCKG